jgi:Tol biopolymer transport system component
MRCNGDEKHAVHRDIYPRQWYASLQGGRRVKQNAVVAIAVFMLVGCGQMAVVTPTAVSSRLTAQSTATFPVTSVPTATLTPKDTLTPTVTSTTTGTLGVGHSISLQARIAFAADPGPKFQEDAMYPPADLYVVDMKGAQTKLHRYTKGMQGHMKLSWSPDGRWIAVHAQEDATPGQSNANLYVLDTVNVQIRKMVQALRPPGQDDLSWLPDSRGVVIESAVNDARQDLTLIDLSTSAQHILTNYDRPIKAPEVAYASQPVVSPDGCCIAYIFSGQLKDESAPDGFRTGSWIRVIDWKGSLVSETGTLCGKDGTLECTGPDQVIESLAWISSGDRVAFEVGCQDLYTVKVDGTDLHHLGHTSSCIRELVWSPVGDWIAGIQPPSSGLPANLYVLSIGESDFGQEIWKQEGVAFYEKPSWSPDGKCIAYIQRRKDAAGLHQDLYVATTDGQATRLLVSDISVNSQPAWSPDSRCGG